MPVTSYTILADKIRPRKYTSDSLQFFIYPPSVRFIAFVLECPTGLFILFALIGLGLVGGP